MPIAEGAKLVPDKLVPAATMRERLSHLLSPDEAVRDPERGPAKYVSSADGRHRVGFITGTTDTYCEGCDRLRVSAAGVLRPCLASDAGVAVENLVGRRDASGDCRARRARLGAQAGRTRVPRLYGAGGCGAIDAGDRRLSELAGASHEARSSGESQSRSARSSASFKGSDSCAVAEPCEELLQRMLARGDCVVDGGERPNGIAGREGVKEASIARRERQRVGSFFRDAAQELRCHVRKVAGEREGRREPSLGGEIEERAKSSERTDSRRRVAERGQREPMVFRVLPDEHEGCVGKHAVADAREVVR